jgi:hypothetical protein
MYESSYTPPYFLKGIPRSFNSILPSLSVWAVVITEIFIPTAFFDPIDLDFWKDSMFLYAKGIISTAIKSSVRYAPEVADSGKRNGQELLQGMPTFCPLEAIPGSLQAYPRAA